LVALLSLSLGAMNILPIPPLDGGKVALEIVEAVSHRQLSRKVTLGISLAGTLLLVTLIGYLMYADVVRVMTSRF
jgi:regulator of sigma E protease